MTGRAKSRGKVGVLGTAVAGAIRSWPASRPLAMVCGGGPAWGLTVAGQPSGTLRVDGSGSQWLGGRAPMPLGRGVMEDLRSALAWGKGRGGWMVAISYELGANLEPAVRRRRSAAGSWPLIELQRCEDFAAFDHVAGEWVRGESPAAAPCERSWAVGELHSQTGQKDFEASVERAIEYIRAGDVYQVNLAHRMEGPFSGSARHAFAAILERAVPWHGAYMELQGEGMRRALLSASPELFLRVDGRRVVTRPMKGTRPASAAASDLRDSGKDQAELNMIIDLMRNDLGHVCRFGTVKVEEARAIERHGAGPDHRSTASQGDGVWQGVGTVAGEMREGVDLVDLLCAAFPAGSVTGAPKIRAMQIIDELEPCERGPYCGSIGWIGDDGRAVLNVAIRTAAIEGKPGAAGLDEIADGRISFSVGAGIVAESVARSEWEETLVKAGVMGFLREPHV